MESAPTWMRPPRLLQGAAKGARQPQASSWSDNRDTARRRHGRDSDTDTATATATATATTTTGREQKRRRSQHSDGRVARSTRSDERAKRKRSCSPGRGRDHGREREDSSLGGVGPSQLLLGVAREQRTRGRAASASASETCTRDRGKVRKGTSAACCIDGAGARTWPASGCGSDAHMQLHGDTCTHTPRAANVPHMPAVALRRTSNVSVIKADGSSSSEDDEEEPVRNASATSLTDTNFKEAFKEDLANSCAAPLLLKDVPKTCSAHENTTTAATAAAAANSDKAATATAAGSATISARRGVALSAPTPRPPHNPEQNASDAGMPRVCKSAASGPVSSPAPSVVSRQSGVCTVDSSDSSGSEAEAEASSSSSNVTQVEDATDALAESTAAGPICWPGSNFVSVQRGTHSDPLVSQDSGKAQVKRGGDGTASPTQASSCDASLSLFKVIVFSE